MQNDLDSVREYLLSKPAVTESLPFGPDDPVYKVIDKIFSIVDLNAPFTIALKCDPERAVRLREQYPAITPGYHMNKQHWNTIVMEEVSPTLLRELIDHSYNLVVSKLPKKVRENLEV